MSLEQAFADPAGSPYSDFSGEISPQAYTTTHQPLPNPQTLISQYSHMLERTGSPISWVPVCEVTADDKEGEKAKKKKFLPLAVYSSFVFPPLRAGEVGFKHAICVFDDEKRSAIAKKISEGHEAMHSSQWARSAALHAVHLNGHSPFVLSVRDWINTTLVTEMEAYAKTALLAWAYKHGNNDRRYDEETRFDPVTVSELEEKLADGHNLSEALVGLAVEGMKKTHHREEVLDEEGDVIGHTPVSFAEYYAAEAFRQYEESVRLNQPKVWQEFPYEIVRLEDRDYQDMGADFGPSIAPDLMQRLDDVTVSLTGMETAIQQFDLNMGIYDPAQLRTFQQGLDAQGWTRDSFIEWSKTPYRRDPSKCAYFGDFKAS